MSDSGNLGQLKTQQWQQLQELADQLEEALSDAESVDLTRFLPPVGTPQRLVFLHELIKTEMEIRCRRNKTVSLDEYLRRYPELGTADTLPPDLIYEEFRVRHRHGDKPAFDLYQTRFPMQFEQLRKLEKKDPVATIYGTVAPRSLAPSNERRTDPKPNTPPIPETLPPETLPPAAAAAAQRPAPGSNPSQVLPAGEGYQLIERIGKGQFGEVYRGLAPGGVVVAIKKILRSMDDDSSQRELKALERIRELRHPYLLQTHKYHAVDDRLIIVMELADGSLRDRFKECKAAGQTGIPPEELLAYFKEAAEALDYLRQEKLSHRDIKPENLLHLKGHAKVADFGVARQQEHTIDQTIHVAGTAAYMPPEMWRGEISMHSDQYSLAATWYEMRTGSRIFSGKTQIEIAQQHLSETPVLSGVPAAEQQVLLRALAKKPDQRYPSCKDFAEALAVALAPKKTAPPPSSRLMTNMLLTVALTITASILFAVLCKSLFSTRVDWTPAQWQPDIAAGVDKDMDGGVYYKRLSKKLGDDEVVMLLMKREKASDPQTFYMMENKVWNRLYRRFADDPAAREALQREAADNPQAVKDEWRDGGEAPGADPKARPDWAKLGIQGAQARVPVVRVTVTEAHYFAEWLGGKLPSREQWFRAAGANLNTTMADEDNTGPFKGRADDPNDLTVNLGLTGPLPVGESQRDVSPTGCRNMAGNGYEWTRDVQGGGVVPYKTDVQDSALVFVLGQDYLELKPLTYREMRKPFVKKYWEASPDTSFRVVLEK